MTAHPWQDVWDGLYSKAMEQYGMTEPEAQVYADKYADQEYEDRLKEAKAEITICAKCAWLHGNAKRDPHWRWMCAAAPVVVINPVCGHFDPPFRFCRTINYGTCHMFKAGSNCLQP